MSCFLSILLIFLCIFARRLGRPNWRGANNTILGDLVRNRFNPANYNQDEACSICLEDFKEDDEIITLPCNKNHIFHAQCILEWLPQNNACPLCKEPVSKETLENQMNANNEMVRQDPEP